MIPERSKKGYWDIMKINNINESEVENGKMNKNSGFYEWINKLWYHPLRKLFWMKDD